MKTNIKTTIHVTAAALLMTMTAVTHAGEPRPGQAGMDAIREQAMVQLRGDVKQSLNPRLEQDLIAAVQLAAPRHMVASGMPMIGPGLSSAAP